MLFIVSLFCFWYWSRFVTIFYHRNIGNLDFISLSSTVKISRKPSFGNSILSSAKYIKESRTFKFLTQSISLYLISTVYKYIVNIFCIIIKDSILSTCKPCYVSLFGMNTVRDYLIKIRLQNPLIIVHLRFTIQCTWLFLRA